MYFGPNGFLIVESVQDRIELFKFLFFFNFV